MTLADQLRGRESPTSPIEGEASQAPTPAELQNPVAAPGRAAILPLAIEYQAAWHSETDGFARHGRAQARALARSGLPVVLRPLGVSRSMLDVELGNARPVTREEEAAAKLLADRAYDAEDLLLPRPMREVRHLRDTTASRIALSIRHVILHTPQALENVIVPPGARLAGMEAQKLVYASTIIYTSWERDTVAPALIEVLRRCAMVWVPCKTNRTAFLRAGMPREKVHVVPCPYDAQTSATARLAIPYGMSPMPEGRRFYTIGKWEPRKNQHNLIGAFLLAFSPKDRASLLIKTSKWGPWKNYPSPPESIAQWAANPRVVGRWTREQIDRRVLVIDKMMSESELLAVHRTNNIYASCSRGEAWDLPAFDAKCAGNVLLYTEGGPSEFAVHAPDIHVAPGATVPVDPEYGWEPDATWLDPTPEHIAHCMLYVRVPDERVHPPHYYSMFGEAAVGNRMKRLIFEYLDRAGSHDMFARLSHISRNEGGGYG